MTFAPRVLDVAVMGVVSEGAHGQLRHVQLAEHYRAGLAQARDGGAFEGRGEVLAREGSTGGRQAGHVAEVLVSERHAVKRAA
jgi:hypothetical protein